MATKKINADTRRAHSRAKELLGALKRADGIIAWMAPHIARMLPPDGGIAELNEHWLYMDKHGGAAKVPKDGPPLDQPPVTPPRVV